MNTLGVVHDLLYDARHAFRTFRMNPGFSATAILTLAIGIGANTAIFCIVNAVLIRPLPYRQPESLIGVFNSAMIQGELINDVALGPGMYAALMQGSAAFEQFGVWSAGSAAVTGSGDPEQISTIVMTQGLLPALGAQPLLGRGFSIEDDRQGAPATVILSHSYWQRRFGGDPKVLARTVVIDSIPHHVIGVMPREFRLLDLAPDVLLPQRFPKGDLPDGPWLFKGIARLKHGVTIDVANRDATRVLNNWSTFSLPDNMRRVYEQFRIRPALRPLKRDVVGDVSSVLGVLMGAVALMLMLVCANLANLVLVKAQARNQEFAIRAALGASPWKIASGLLEESVILGLLGGALGMAVAYGAVRILKAQDLTSIPRLAEVSIDAGTVAFALACSIGASLVFGLIAIWKCGIPDRVLGARGSTMRVEQRRTQNLLVVAQVALALVLLVASGLLIRSFLAMRAIHPGFTHPEHIQNVRLSIPETQVPQPERVARMQFDIVNAVSRIPGVTAAALAEGMPMDAETRDTTPVAVEERVVPGQPPPIRDTKYISPGLFATQGTRLLAGRDFTWEDVWQHRLVAIVSENMARESWGDLKAAPGKRLRPGAAGNYWFEVVGVVENVHDEGPHKTAPPMVYFRCGVYALWPARTRRNLTLAIRSVRAGSGSFLREVAAAIHSANPSLPLAQVRTLEYVYRHSMARTSFTLTLLVLAGAVALTLAIIGVYGVLAYVVGQRRREVGIRIALGARPGQVKALVVRRAFVLACAGGSIGLATAVGLSRWVSSVLFGITALDPVTYVSSAAIILAAAIIASYIPALRAASVDPVECLRAD